MEICEKAKLFIKKINESMDAAKTLAEALVNIVLCKDSISICTEKFANVLNPHVFGSSKCVQFACIFARSRQSS